MIQHPSLAETNGYRLTLLFFCVLAVSIGMNTIDKVASVYKKPHLNSVLMKAADNLNRNLPIMIDGETRLDTTIGTSREFQYQYTMINYALAELDLAEFVAPMTVYVTNSYCTSTSMEIFRNNHVSIRHTFRDKDGKHFSEISVTPDACETS